MPAPRLCERRQRARRRRGAAPALARGVHRALVRHLPRVARVRADEHHRALGVRPAGHEPLPGFAGVRAAPAGCFGNALHAAVERGRDDGCRRRPQPGVHGGVGARERGSGRDRTWKRARRAEPRDHRHRRHHRQVRAGPGARAAGDDGLFHREDGDRARLSDQDPGRRDRRDRQRRRQRRRPRRRREAPGGAGERGRGPGAGRLRARRRPADDHRRARPDRPDRRLQPARRAHRGRCRAGAPRLRSARGDPSGSP